MPKPSERDWEMAQLACPHELPGDAYCLCASLAGFFGQARTEGYVEGYREATVKWSKPRGKEGEGDASAP